MSQLVLTEWLNSRETAALVAFLRRRRGAAVQTFLAGQPVDLVTQGRAAALHEIETLLSGRPEHVKQVFETP
jgi:hypothetical protein